MDTPEKSNFLETIRELRREADEKLMGNRHYLAIQKLDEIAEAVQQREMSSEELGAVSEVLRGDVGEASLNIEQPLEPQSSPVVDIAAAGAGVAAATMAAGAVGSLSEPPVADEPVAQVVEQAAPDTGKEQVLPNWWKEKGGEEALADLDASPPAIEPEPVIAPESAIEPEPVIEIIADNIEETSQEGSFDPTSVAAGAAVAGVAAGLVASQLSSETVETAGIAEEIELIEVPEVEIEAADVELPVINIETIEAQSVLPEVAPEIMPEIELPDIAAIAAPQIEPEVEIAVPQIELPDVEVIAAPQIEPDVELAGVPEAVEVVALPEVVLPEVALPEVAPPEPHGLVVENVAREIVIPEVALADIPDMPAPEASAQIADLLSDVDVDTSAAVAAGAAIATVGAAVAMRDEPAAPEEVELVEAQAAKVPVTPEELSFPGVPETSVQEVAPPEVAAALPAAKILNGDNIARHPDYGGSRGGIMKRFVNALRGKDYI